MSDAQTDTLTDYYDAVPYDSHPFPQTAPEHLEALAYLFGVETAAPANARVLELGCASGGNLIPFSSRYPDSNALGIDLSSVQIKDGLASIQRTDLTNIELKAFNLVDVDASMGQFDYIVCHGVYSWVPGAVQDAILRICSENLAPNGVAYVSYNVYPGWKAREIVRDAMILRGGPRDTPDEKLAYARGMLEFLEQSARPNSVLHKTLEETMPLVRNARASYLLHEFLEPCNAPCYFKDFVARAESHGLSYLSDAETSTMFVQNYGEQVREPLMRECGESQVLMEQYLDFIVNRTFRQTLLVKKAAAERIRYRLDVDRIRNLSFAGVFSAQGGGGLIVDESEQVCTAMRGLTVTFRNRVQKAAAQLLDEHYPAALDADALVKLVADRARMTATSVEPVVSRMLEELLILGAVRIRRTPVGAATRVAAQPLADRTVRKAPSLALDAGPEAAATNQWHELVSLTILERSLLPLLDGEHSHNDLAAHLTAEAVAGRLRLTKEGKVLEEPSELLDFATLQVGAALLDLRRKGLLLQ